MLLLYFASLLFIALLCVFAIQNARKGFKKMPRAGVVMECLLVYRRLSALLVDIPRVTSEGPKYPESASSKDLEGRYASRRPGGRVVSASILLLVLAGSRFSSATIVPSMSFEELVASSDQIVSGTVVRAYTSWGPEHRLIWTRYEIRVGDTIKGARQDTVVVSEPGGSLAGQGMRVDGAVPYETGEHVTLFLHRYPSGDERTVGWAQGKFTTDANGRVHPGSAGGRLELNVKAGSPRATPLVQLNGITAGELRRRILTASAGRVWQ
jgi:hypothetical protein